MTQIKDYPERDLPIPSDFLYLVTAGNSDYKILIQTLLGELTNSVVDPFYELVIADQYHTIRMAFAGNKEITIPDNLAVPFVVGTVIRIRNASSTIITINPITVAITLNTKSGLVIPARGEVKLVYMGSDEWDVIGDLTV